MNRGGTMSMGRKVQSGGEMLSSGTTMPNGALVDLRAISFDPSAGYTYNSSIANSRTQQVFPIVAVGSTNVITYDIAPTGSTADYYDLFNSFFSLEWYWSAVGAGGSGSSWQLFHSLLLFQTVRIYLNGTEIDDESNNAQHMADFHKLILEQPRQPVPYGTPNVAGSTWCITMPEQGPSRGIQGIPFTRGQSMGDNGAGTTHYLVDWLNTIGNAFPSLAGVITTTYKPYQSIFTCKAFIPCCIRLRFEFTKFSADWTMATVRPNAGVAPGVFTPVLQQMTLYLRIVTLTNQTLRTASELSLRMPITLPVLRANTNMFPIAGGTQQINIQVTGQRRPQVMILHAVATSVTNPTTKAASAFPFATVSNDTGVPVALMQIASLYLRNGANRYPALFDRTRIAFTANGGNCGTSGGTIEYEYQEYANLTKQYMDGDKFGVQPFFARENFEDPVTSGIWVFNLSPAQETFQDRSVLETLSITGTIDIIMNLQQATDALVPISLFVTTLTNEKITIDPVAGRIGRSW